MKSLKTLYFVIVIIILLTVSKGSRKLKYKFAYCDFDQQYIKVIHCHVKVISRNVQAIKVKIQYQRTLKNFVIHINLHKKYNGWRPYLFNFDFDLCKFFLNMNTNLLAKHGYNIISNSTNVNHTCPYVKGEVSYLDFQTLEDNNFARILSLNPIETGDFGIFATFYSQKRFIGTTNISFSYTDYSQKYK